MNKDYKEMMGEVDDRSSWQKRLL